MCYNIIVRLINFCLVRYNIVFYNPTHLLREFSSGCGLQTSRHAEEGSVKQSGVYPPASCGFYSLYKRQGGFFLNSAFKRIDGGQPDIQKRAVIFLASVCAEAFCLYRGDFYEKTSSRRSENYKIIGIGSDMLYHIYSERRKRDSVLFHNCRSAMYSAVY